MGLRFSLYALLPLQQEPRAPHDVKFLLLPFHDKPPSPRKRPLYLSPPARERSRGRLLPLRRPSRRLRACAGQRRGRSPRNFPSGAPAGRTETGERCGGGGGGGRWSPLAPPPGGRRGPSQPRPAAVATATGGLRSASPLGIPRGGAPCACPPRRRHRPRCVRRPVPEARGGRRELRGWLRGGGREEEGGGAAMAAGYHYRPNGGGGGAALPDPSFLWNVFQR